MKNLNKSSEKMGVLSASKTVKFKKDKTPLTQKKKFAKTPHSSKTPKDSDSSITSPAEKNLSFRNKRKLSFSSADEASPAKITSNKNKVKTPTLKKKKADLIVKSVEANEDSENDMSDSSDEEVVKSPSANGKTKFKRSKLTRKQIVADKQTNTVFVGNLPVAMTKLDVKKEFTKFGKVVNARLRCIPLTEKAKNRRAGAILQQVAGTSVSAFVKFSNPEDAEKALSNNGKLIDGHHIRVDHADPALQEKTDKKKAVFLRHLHNDLSEDELWSAFEKCGKVKSVRIIKDTKTYLGRGLGYVNFTTTGAVELALKLHNTEIKGKKIVVQRCETKPNFSKPRGKMDKKQLKVKGSPKKIGKPHDVKVKNERKIKKEASKSDSEAVPIKKKATSDFSGKKSKLNKIKKDKKLSASGIKKKKIAEILTKTL